MRLRRSAHSIAALIALVVVGSASSRLVAGGGGSFCPGDLDGNGEVGPADLAALPEA